MTDGIILCGIALVMVLWGQEVTDWRKYHGKLRNLWFRRPQHGPAPGRLDREGDQTPRSTSPRFGSGNGPEDSRGQTLRSREGEIRQEDGSESEIRRGVARLPQITDPFEHTLTQRRTWVDLVPIEFDAPHYFSPDSSTDFRRCLCGRPAGGPWHLSS